MTRGFPQTGDSVYLDSMAYANAQTFIRRLDGYRRMIGNDTAARLKWMALTGRMKDAETELDGIIRRVQGGDDG